MATKVIMPQLGESVVEGTVTKWLKREGESIAEFEPLLEVNTDKVDSEIPSPASGTVLKILVAEGTTVAAGTLLAWIGQPDEVLEGIPAPVDHAPHETPDAHSIIDSPLPAPSPGRDRDLGFISPVVAKLAREKQVDLYKVRGTGEGGRITKRDVLAYLEAQAKAPTPEPAAWETPGEGDLFRPTELMFPQAKEPERTAALQSALPRPSAVEGDTLIPLTTMRKSIAAAMALSKQTAPHVTTVMEADLSRVVAHRQAHKAAFERDGANLTYTAYFIAAIIAGLKAFPLVNSSWHENAILVHKAINIGMAVSLGDEGLIVPVIRNADTLSLLGIARAVNDLAARARARKLQPDEVKGSTFSLTNHGTGGSLFASPVINQPNCAIIGAGTIQKRVVVIDDAIAIRPMVYLTLTFDHRILDGYSGDGFLAKVVQTLENWQ